ncbi:MAG: hypothetical protein P8J32_04085 [bacterium]|jgi:hypothetical protein|nr:hypothetical protein [bacterium]
MHADVVAMFCGPRDEGDGSTPSMRRITGAIDMALRLGTPLIIAGDSFGGYDVRFYAQAAEARGVEQVFGMFDPRITRPDTLSDARLIVRSVVAMGSIRLVHVVTDDYHVARASAMFCGEYVRVTRDSIGVNLAPVSGFHITDVMRENEARGLAQYLKDPESYGTSRPTFDPLRVICGSSCRIQAHAK